MIKDNKSLKVHAHNMRQHIMDMALVAEGSAAHIGGSMSIVEILSYLYFNEMNIPSLESANRDRFILSKGHAALAYYAVLIEKGYISE